MRWNNHQISVMSVFSKLLQNESLVDVTLACEGSRMKAHKVVLSACSPYFQAIFEENPCQHPVVILKGFCLSDLKSIIEFIYKGEVNISQQSLNSFLKTAEMLQISGLANAASVTSNSQTETDGYISENAAERDFASPSSLTPAVPTSLASSTTTCHGNQTSNRTSRAHKNKQRQHDGGKRAKVPKEAMMQQPISEHNGDDTGVMGGEPTENFAVCDIKKDSEDLENEEMVVTEDVSEMNGSLTHPENSHLYSEPHPVTLHPSTSSEGSTVDWSAGPPQSETWIGPENVEQKGPFAEGRVIKEETPARMPHQGAVRREPVNRCRKQWRLSNDTKRQIIKAVDEGVKKYVEIARDFQIGERTLYGILKQRYQIEES